MTIILTARIDSATPAGTFVTNQGTANFDTDNNGTNESSAPTNPVSFTVVDAVTLTATKTATGPFYPGSDFTYTVVLTNAGPSTQPDNPENEFVDALPASVTGVTANATSGTDVGGGDQYRQLEWEPGERRLGDDHDHRDDHPSTALGTVVTNQGAAFSTRTVTAATRLPFSPTIRTWAARPTRPASPSPRRRP